MDGLNIDREGDQVDLSTEDGRKKLHEAASALSKATIPIDIDSIKRATHKYIFNVHKLKNQPH